MFGIIIHVDPPTRIPAAHPFEDTFQVRRIHDPLTHRCATARIGNNFDFGPRKISTQTA
jgi:hypothetical protein